MHRKIIVVTALALVASASLVSLSCAESTDGVTPVVADASSPDGTTVSPGPTANDGAAAPDSPMVTASSVLINELSPTAEWVELVSTGSTALDVSGFRVADSEKDGGGPKLKDAVTFPDGTIMSPKTYLIVQGGGLDGGGKHCPDGGQSYCFNAEFGVSNKSGETLYLLDKGGAVVGTAVYPAMGAPSGDTWGRVPSGDPSGKFEPTASTPGATNKAP